MMRTAFAIAMWSLSLPGAAQRSEPVVALPDAASPDDIIVQGLRIPREKLPTAVYWDYQTVLPSRIARENSEMFLRCALKSSDVASIRQVVDGEPNSARARFAQGWILQTHAGCYPPSRLAGYTQPNQPIGISDLGESRLDRGVIVEWVLTKYAPNAALTPEMTKDPAIERRFVAREGLRNRLRLSDDRDNLRFAACLVQEQPVLATRLFRSRPGSTLERGLSQAIIVEGRSCIGGASRITIDPSLLRVYVVDAFYRWNVAAQGVDSLIPTEA